MPLIGGGANPQNKRLFSEAKRKLAEWSDSAGIKKQLRPQLLGGLERVMHTLPERREWFEVQSILIGKSIEVSLRLEEPHFRAFTSRRGVGVTTIAPAWNVGWGQVLKRPEVYEVLSWFLHYARQYVHRSRVAAVLMAALERNGQALHPFAAEAIYQRYGPTQPMTTVSAVLNEGRDMALRQWGRNSGRIPQVTQTDWAGWNTLDPSLHLGIAHLLRAEQLLKSDFTLEAVVAFDCVIQAMAGYLSVRQSSSTSPTRGQVCRELGLSKARAGAADYAYFIRNNFGAHPRGWRWWDVDEMLSEQALSAISGMARCALRAAADREPTARLVDPAPTDWPEWLLKNFVSIWDAVWFREMDVAGHRP
ncbi:hypothetical protein [Methylobacterium sp. J-092]|uniref:hypothetical protein n=1 Tax=Methylobacterium sp. J-092 TaxID=2836667 RepID=UPI001FB978F0|nr:hypothetical protein [Methylobacterium sp. J-092]MCJ2006456.1 hypothetical protein [Methylobacterium sp. J-092]